MRRQGDAGAHPGRLAALGMAMIGTAVAGACGESSPPGPAHRYAELAGAANPEGCEALADPDLAAECRAFAAWELARRGDEAAAEATCASLPGGTWRDECFFQLADILAATGERGRALCARAGGFQGHCIGHGIGRESQAILAASEIGDEPAAFDAVLEVATTWVGPRRARSRAEGILRQALAARFPPGTPFDVARCGAAPTHLCRDAYIELVVERAGLDGARDDGVDAAVIGRACATGGDREAVEALGLPGWTPASAPVVAEAWDRICNGGGRPLAPGRGRRSPGAPNVQP